ncbi:hypothetical protein [Martelella soudanensis]|uniref:hypothetical protein n=1 Tax=unclassified Martelella TaxID=2629616 RepID=UPI0015DEB8A8|nr:MULTISPECIES: hypothetical protein [unclassified Martelella]
MAELPEAAARLAATLFEDERLHGDYLASAVLALALLDLARDSRSAAKRLSTAHALVLRAVAMLGAEPPLLTLDRRDPRTQRQFYAPATLALSFIAD